MIRINVTDDGFLAAEIAVLLPTLVDKMAGKIPDRSDTATLAYVTLRALDAKAKQHAVDEVIEFIMSNDAAYALQHELRTADILWDLLETVEHKLQDVEKAHAERQADDLRRNSTPVRQRWSVRERAEG